MSEALNVMSWNVAENDTGGINNPAVRQVIFDHEPSIAVFPEALPEDGMRDDTLRAFANAGYELGKGLWWDNYDDVDGRKDRHALTVIARPELVLDASRMRSVGRTSILLSLENGASFLGVHLDDRNEARRSLQAERLLFVDRGHTMRTMAPDAIVAGDMNAMHGKTMRAAMLRAAGPMAYALPSRTPGEEPQGGSFAKRLHAKIERVGSLSQRLTEMADGKTMNLFTEAGFTDADPSHAVTMKKAKGLLAAQLDRVVYRGDFDVVKSTVVECHSGDLSDHSSIHAVLQQKPAQVA